MKKYIILSFITLSIILTVIATGYTKVNNIDYISAVKVEYHTAVDILNYNGTVEYRNSSAVLSDGMGAVHSVLVENGDFVEKGDPVMTVFQTDKELTQSDIMSGIASGDFSGISGISQDDFTIKVYEASVSGIVSGLDVDDGTMFQRGQTLFKISPEKAFQVQINVVEKDIQKIQVGQEVKIDCKAVPQILYGEVSSIGKSAKQTTTTSGKETTVKVTIKINDENPDVRSGYTAACAITTAQKENTLLIPYSCVSCDEKNKSYVYVLNGNTVQKKYITVGNEYNNGIEVLSGLKSGDIIAEDSSKVVNPESTIINEVKENVQ